MIMPRDGAAESAEELVLLRDLTARMGDVDMLGIYNDWLDDRDDPRGDHLRRSLAAFAYGEALPERPRGISAEWEEVVGLGPRHRLRERSEAYGRLAPHLTALLDAGRACMRLRLLPRQPMSGLPPGRSRAGGVPDLPAGMPWPMFDDELCGGRWPMLFLVQIDLADLAGTLCEGVLPAAGLVTLFFYPENAPRGLELLYTPPGVPLERVWPPEPYCFNPLQIGDVNFPTDHTRPVRLTETIRYPDGLPDELSDLDFSGDDGLAWLLLGDAASPRHHFASPLGRGVCPQWEPGLYFAEVPASHV